MSLFKKRILGIDIHDYSAELIEIEQRGSSMYLKAYNRVLLPTDVIKNGEIKKADELKEILKKLIVGANPKAIETKNVAMIFPPSKVLTHIFSFPLDLSEKEIRKSIEYEAETIIPFLINDVYWDFMIIDQEDKTKKHASQYAFFACINKKEADTYISVLEEVGLNPVVSGINAETLKYAMWAQIEENETSLIIDIEALSVNYLILENQKIKHFFSSNEGGKKLLGQLSDKLQSPEELLLAKKEEKKFTNIEEIKDFIERNYKRANGIIDEINEKSGKIKVQNIILTGEFLNLPNFFELAKEHFPNQKILIGDPKLNLKIEQDRFVPMEKRSAEAIPYSSHFTNAIGIAIRGVDGISEMNEINLLPGRLKESITNKKKVLIVAIAAIMMASIALFLATYQFFQHQDLKYERMRLEIEKSAIEKMIYGVRYQGIRDEILVLNNEINELTVIDKGLFSLPNTLQDVLDLIPKGIELKVLDFKDEGLSISIAGIAKTRNQLLEIQNNFENAEFIEEVFAPISNFDEELQISFLIQIKLNFIKLAKYGSN